MKVKQNSDLNYVNSFKAIIYSLISLFIFFIPISINNEVKTIFFHIIKYIKLNHIQLVKITSLIFIIIGSIKNIYKSSKDNDLYKYIRLSSIVIIFSVYYGKSDVFLVDNNTLLILNEIIIDMMISLFVGSLFSEVLINSIFIELFEYYFSKISKKLFNISGRGVFCVILFIFTDYFFGFFILNRMYSLGKLRQKEASMIFLNFFIIPFYLYKYIMELFDLDMLRVFILSIIMFIIINFIMCRIYPINKKKKSYLIKNKVRSKDYKNINEVIDYVSRKINKNLIKNTLNNIEDSIELFMNVAPDIIIIMFIISSIIFNIDLLGVFEFLICPILEFFKYNSISELSDFFVLNFYNNIFSVENMDFDVNYIDKVLIFLVLSLNSISLTSNIVLSKVSKINVSKSDFIITYVIRLFLIISIYSSFLFLYKGYFIV